MGKIRDRGNGVGGLERVRKQTPCRQLGATIHVDEQIPVPVRVLRVFEKDKHLALL